MLIAGQLPSPFGSEGSRTESEADAGAQGESPTADEAHSYQSKGGCALPLGPQPQQV